LATLLGLQVERKRETLQRGWREVPAWLFVNQDGRRLNPRRVGEAFARALKAGRPPGHFTPHSPRHTYASLLLADGTSPAYVKEQLGHASISMTVDLYGKWLPASNHGAVDRLDERSKSGQHGSKTVATGVPEGV
jgi:integrase